METISKGIVGVLSEQDKGRFAADCSKALEELVAAVRATTKAGSLTISIKIAPASKSSAEAVFVDATITAKVPTEERKPTLFFTTESNQLSRYNERQRALFEAESPVIDVTAKEIA
jgi:hypothetical protein